MFKGTKIYCDGVQDANHLRHVLARWPMVQGFTTNPTLMKQAGVVHYERWAKELLAATDLPISFEVVSDIPVQIEKQARILASWGPNVYVKIPITTTTGWSTVPIVCRLAADDIAVNVTAVMTIPQVLGLQDAFSWPTPMCVSVFAGRIADTGRDPYDTMTGAKSILEGTPNVELIWASPREVLNLTHANDAECDIITMTPALLEKLTLAGKDLAYYSRETVQMFYDDACKAGYTL